MINANLFRAGVFFIVALSALSNTSVGQTKKDRDLFKDAVKNNRCGGAVWPPESGDVIATGALVVFNGSSFKSLTSRNVTALCSNALPPSYALRKLEIRFPNIESSKSTKIVAGKLKTDGSWAQEPIAGLDIALDVSTGSTSEFSINFEGGTAEEFKDPPGAMDESCERRVIDASGKVKRPPTSIGTKRVVFLVEKSCYFTGITYNFKNAGNTTIDLKAAATKLGEIHPNFKYEVAGNSKLLVTPKDGKKWLFGRDKRSVSRREDVTNLGIR
jgi:hypothetical protein